jgi:hypothetical protein
VLKLTDAAYKLVLSRSQLGIKLRQQVIRTLLRVRPVRERILGRLTGLGIHYDRPSGAHPSTGRRMPDLPDVDQHRVYEALRTGRFVLVARAGVDVAGVESERLTALSVDFGAKTPAVTLVRPDGYVAWASDTGSAAEVRAAVEHWCPPVLATQR